MGLLDNFAQSLYDYSPAGKAESLSNAWEQMNQGLQRDQTQAKDQYYKGMVSKQEEAEGYAPGEFYTDKGRKEARQGLEQSNPYQISELDRWKNQIDAMMASNNPVLQQEAVKMISQHRERATKPKPAIEHTTLYKQGVEMGLSGKRLQDWMRRQKSTTNRRDYELAHPNRDITFEEYLARKGKSSVTSKDDPNRLPTVQELDRLKHPDGSPVSNVPIGMTMADLADKGYLLGQKPMSDSLAKEFATTDIALQMVDEIRELTESGEASLSGIPGKILEFRNKPGWLNAIGDFAGNAFGMKDSAKNVQLHSLSQSLSNQVLYAYRGAQVGPEEQVMFDAQLPKPGMSDQKFLSNLYLTERNLRYKRDLEKFHKGYSSTLPLLKDYQVEVPYNRLMSVLQGADPGTDVHSGGKVYYTEMIDGVLTPMER